MRWMSCAVFAGTILAMVRTTGAQEETIDDEVEDDDQRAERAEAELRQLREELQTLRTRLELVERDVEARQSQAEEEELAALRQAAEEMAATPETAEERVESVVTQMRTEKINVIIAANYYDETRVHNIAKKVGAKAVIVPLGVGGEPEARDYFSFIDLIVSRIAAAYRP